jgi:hypothetical protein
MCILVSNIVFAVVFAVALRCSVFGLCVVSCHVFGLFCRMFVCRLIASDHYQRCAENNTLYK